MERFKRPLWGRPLWQWLLALALVLVLILTTTSYYLTHRTITSSYDDGRAEKAQATYTVASLYENLDDVLRINAGDFIEVKGLIKEIDNADKRIALVDESDANGVMLDCFFTDFSENVLSGDLVQVTGRLSENDGGGVKLEDSYLKVLKTVDEVEKEHAEAKSKEEKAKKDADAKKKSTAKVVPKPSSGSTSVTKKSSSTTSTSTSTSTPSQEEKKPASEEKKPEETKPEEPKAPENEKGDVVGDYTYSNTIYGFSLYVPKDFTLVQDASDGTHFSGKDGSTFVAGGLQNPENLSLQELAESDALNHGLDKTAVALEGGGYRFQYKDGTNTVYVRVIQAGGALARLAWTLPDAGDPAVMNQTLQSFHFN